MVQLEQCDTQIMTHPGITQRNSGRPLQEEPDPINRVVPLSTNLQTSDLNGYLDIRVPEP